MWGIFVCMYMCVKLDMTAEYASFWFLRSNKQVQFIKNQVLDNWTPPLLFQSKDTAFNLRYVNFMPGNLFSGFTNYLLINSLLTIFFLVMVL